MWSIFSDFHRQLWTRETDSAEANHARSSDHLASRAGVHFADCGEKIGRGVTRLANLMSPEAPPNHISGNGKNPQPSGSGDSPALLADEVVPTLLDLIPHRRLPLGLLLTGTAVIALLLASYRGFGAERPAWVGSPIPAFAMDGPGNLASFFSSLTLTVAGVYALINAWLIQWLWRERGGTWLAAAGCWFFMAVDASAGLHRAIAQLAGDLAGVSPQGAIWWWVIPYSIAFLALASRLMMDLRQSLAAAICFAAATACYGASLLVQIGLLPGTWLPLEPALCQGLTQLAGHWLILTTMVSFSAHLVHEGLVEESMEETLGAEKTARPNTEPASRPKNPPKQATTARPRRTRKGVAAPPASTPRDESGEVLIIHPPHGHGPPRVVRRIVRKRTATGNSTPPAPSPRTPRKRSDLDLPRKTVRTKSPAATSNNRAPSQAAQPPVSPRPIGASHETTNTNAFLAGMAYAEAQRPTAEPASPSSSVPVRPPAGYHAPARTLDATRLSPDSANADSQAGFAHFPTASAAAGHSAGVAESGPSLAVARQGSSTIATGQNAASVSAFQAASPGMTVTTSETLRPQNLVPGGTNSQSGGTNPQSNGNPTGTNAGGSPVPLPARKLTKEEKKRLKQLYKQQMAEQAGGNS